MAPWLFLAVTVVGACFTFNAYLPRLHRSPLIVPSFFAGWLTSELSAHHFAWQLVATIGFVWAGALEAWPGWVGLGITFASWAGLLALVGVARRSDEVVEKALVEGLGDDYRRVAAADETPVPPLPRSRLVIPLLLYDRGLRVTRNIRYAPGAGKRHLLDVYRSRGNLKNAPVLLQIHGGAWVIGDKAQQALPLMTHLAARGWVCVAANYRLSPRSTFPDHLLDVKLALRWVRQEIERFGGDPDFVVITGGSAGGHLCSLAALTANDPEYQPGFEAVDTSVRACVPFYGVYDFANELGIKGYHSLERFLGRVVMKTRFAQDRAAFEKASPLFRVHAGAPPMFIIHGTHDSLAPVEDGRGFARKLREISREPVVYAELPGAQHAFEVFHSLRTRHVVLAVDRFLAWVHARYQAEQHPAASATPAAQTG